MSSAPRAKTSPSKRPFLSRASPNRQRPSQSRRPVQRYTKTRPLSVSFDNWPAKNSCTAFVSTVRSVCAMDKSKSVAGSSSRIPDRGATIRRTASLDAIYLKGLFPKESVFWHRDRATQTDRSNSLDSLQTLAASETLEERVSKLTLNPRRRSCSREDKGDQAPLIRNRKYIKSHENHTKCPQNSRYIYHVN
jgi:hypothetical protein